MGPAYGRLFDATAQLLYTRSCYGGTTDAYRGFVDALEPGDIILTFNWDSCPEIALHSAGRPFSRQMNGVAPEDMPWLLKLHGSIDYLIVDLDVGVNGREGTPEFLEALGAVPPSPIPGRSFEVVRLKTYDLGFEVELDVAAARDRKTRGMAGVVGGYDVGPFLLMRELTEYPTLHMLTPGSPRVLYDWQYHLVSRLLASVCPEVSEITVAGYSFPDYDKPVHQVLRTIHKLAGKPSTHIVNPAAATLAPDLLKSIFGTCELHPVGFGEHTWRR
jgi:predicted heme/steroid binding protein